jgi:hypothetical protein
MEKQNKVDLISMLAKRPLGGDQSNSTGDTGPKQDNKIRRRPQAADKLKKA